MNTGNKKVLVPIAAGTIREIIVDEPEILDLNKKMTFEASDNGIIALDGEREIPFKPGDRFDIVITRNGPYRVIVDKTLEYAQRSGFFNR